MYTDTDFVALDNLDSSGANGQLNSNFTQGDFLSTLESSFQTTGSFSTPALELVSADEMKMEFHWNFPAFDFKYTVQPAHSVNYAYEWNHSDSLTGDSINSDSTDSVTGDVLTDSEAVLGAAVYQAKDQLESFANDGEFLAKMNQAFDLDVDSEQAKTLIEDLASGETMPTLEIVSASELDNANAAFGEGTIYLSEEFLDENTDSPEAVESVLLEEIGHYVDEELGDDDSSGDEGDIFAQLVRDETITEAELDDLQTEDDSATIGIDGEIDVELAAPPYPGYSFDYNGEPSVPYDENVEIWQQQMQDLGYTLTVDGKYGPESESVARQFQSDQGLVVDGIVGPNTWEASFAASEARTPYTIEAGDTLSQIAADELGDASLWREIEREDGSTFTEEEASQITPGQVVYLPDDTDVANFAAIATQEWEFFDQGSLTETEEGAWQRIGEYWESVNLDYDGKDTGWPWSAAFISWVMQQGGAGDRFEYSASHSTYITDAVEDRKNNDSNAAFFGYELDEYSPQVGDLVGYARQDGVDINTQGFYASHTDLVVAVREGEIDVIGGNVSDSVTKKTLVTDSQGRLIDTSEDWFVVLSNRLT